MRVVFCSDTHLGLDVPVRPRASSSRRPRGEDFFDNLERVLEHAQRERADLVLHGGDLFFRSRVPPAIVDRVAQRLARFVADSGIPLGVIAGNHERSRLPPSLWWSHPLIHVFGTPHTHVFSTARGRVAVTGVPFIGDGARFVDAVRATDVPRADAHLLLAHEAFAGARCGPSDFEFSAARSDVVDQRALPAHFRAVLSGHIHRRQVLWRTRNRDDDDDDDDGAGGRPMPIVYAGSVERTSFAEQGEQKAFAVVDLDEHHGRLRFVPLPARPMLELGGAGQDPLDDDEVLAALGRAPSGALVRLWSSATQAQRLPRTRLLAAAARDVHLALRINR